jgi:hypothetical protein
MITWKEDNIAVQARMVRCVTNKSPEVNKAEQRLQILISSTKKDPKTNK